MRIRNSKNTYPYLLAYLLIISLLVIAQSAWAAGPVDASSLPGGATVTDSDGGSGEQWGRIGGRTWGYSGFALSNFTMLEYQPIAAAAAFDNEITGGTLEEMTGPVLIAPDTLQWTGETTIYNDISNVWVTAYTRFTVISSVNFTGPAPYVVDVIGAGGMFDVNVLFEASLAPGGPWEPALDFFDAYPTGIAQDGFAHTSYLKGFFYELEEGLTLEEHDANLAAHDAGVHSRFDDVDNAVEYLTLESLGRIANVDEKVMDANFKLMLIQSGLDELLEGGGGDHATQEGLDNLQNFIAGEAENLSDRLSEFQQLMICMWVGDAIFPICPPEVPPGLPSLLGLESGQDELMDKLDELLAQQEGSCEIVVEARHSAPASTMGNTVLAVLTSHGGAPTDAAVLAITAITASPMAGIGAVALDFTPSPVSTGLQSVELDIPDGIGVVKHLVIEAEHVVDGLSCPGTGLADLLGSGDPEE